MAVTLVYDDRLSRVRISAAGLSVVDTFTRAVSDGWGPADSGHPWTVVGTTADYSTSGTQGRQSLGTVGSLRTSMVDVGASDMTLTADVTIPVMPASGAITVWAAVRTADTGNYYTAQLNIAVGGAVTLAWFRRVGGALSGIGGSVAVGTHAAGATWRIAADVAGAQLRAKAWRLGAGADPGWQSSAVDTALSGGTQAGLLSRLESGNTNTLPVVAAFDNVSVVPSVRVERSTDQIRWTVVRGGAALTPTGGSISLDDYEFVPGVVNYYRAAGQSGQITPVDHRLWVKSIARPFLNRPLPTVTDVSPISRPARSGLFSPLGRPLPIAINSARGSRRWTLTVLTQSPSEAETLDLILASGDPLYLQVPPGSNVPGGYVTVGDSDEGRYPGQGGQPDEPRAFVLPLTEVAPPAAHVVGATVTCQTVLVTYPTCADVLAEHPTCADLLELIGDPSDVIVS